VGQLPPVRIAHVHNPVYQLSEHLADRASRYTKQVGRVLVDRLATSVGGTSAQLLREYGYERDLESGRAEAVYCGFDVSPFAGDKAAHRRQLISELGKPDDAKVILFVGRLGGSERATGGRSHKNPALALEIAADCIRRDSRFNILFVGSGDSMQSVLEERARELNVSDHVFFLGQRHDIPHLMCAADALLFPSSAEGLGMVTVEAQAAGLPVLASDTTPRECVVVPELVTFMSLSSPPEVWADELLRIAATETISRSGANLRVAASPFAIENSASKLVSLYTRAGLTPST
jgi:glycosyltransferase involved in cell wall biosynthesis